MLLSYEEHRPRDNCHMVRAGDTFYTISKFYNISLDDLAEANPHVEPELLSQGQVIRIPYGTAPVNGCPAGASSYEVQKGDSFYSIARKNKVSFSALLKANPGINPDALLTGQRLCVPVTSSIYTSRTYRVKFAYPYRWSKVDDVRYAGIDGFFHVSAISGAGSLQAACRSEASHRLKPYGVRPSISSTTVDNQEACIIMPSADQPKEMRGQSALIARYPEPLVLGDTQCQYLLILTDHLHLRDLAGSLEFLDEGE